MIPLDVDILNEWHAPALSPRNGSDDDEQQLEASALQDTTNFGGVEQKPKQRTKKNSQPSQQPIGLPSFSLHSLYSWILGLTCLELQSLIVNRQKLALKNLVQLLLTENGGVTASTSTQSASAQPSSISRMFGSSGGFDSLLFMNRGSAAASAGKNLFQGKTLFQNSKFSVFLFN